MPRIPDELIDRLKREVSLAQEVEASGVKLEKRGKSKVGLCPLHPDEKTPSLVVTESKRLWRCFGCSKGGSVVDWRMATRGQSFREAIEGLIADHLPDVDLAEAEESAEPEQLPAEELERLLELSDQALLRWVVDDYHERAKVNPRVTRYLRYRGLEHPELVDHFRIGTADRTLLKRFPGASWKAGKAIRERLQEIGITRDTGYESLSGRVLVPLWSLDGEVAQLYGRLICRGTRPGNPDHMYLERPQDGVLDRQVLATSEELILCESILDALTFWCAGFRNVASSLSATHFPKALEEAIDRHGTKRVLVAYDRDDAGDKGARAVAERLQGAGVDCWRVLLPKGVDVNEHARRSTPAAKWLDLALRRAEWMGEGRPPGVRDAGGVESGSSKKAAEKEAAAAAPSSAASSDSGAAAPVPNLEPAPADATPAMSPATEPAAERTTAALPPGSPTILPATPGRSEVPMEVSEQQVVIALGDRRYRIRGLDKNLAPDTLRINLLATREDHDGLHVNTFDLYAERPRAGFVRQAAEELGVEREVIKGDLRRLLLALEELQEERIREALEPETAEPAMSEADRERALEHLRRPDLLAKTAEDLGKAGIVGEDTNKLVVYFAALSRKLQEPLAVLVQSSSAAGKSALLNAVLALVPEEDRVEYSAMTGQSLFYMGETSLEHKVLAIAEEEGAERASYALKLLQSEGKLSIASTGKDPHTGRLVTHEYHVTGPAAIVTTTTAIDLDEELVNRCIVLTVDESREQTEAIHRYQRRLRTLEGLAAREERQEVLELHRNVQRLLEPLEVINPFAEELAYPSSCTRTRRDHLKYLGLIEAIALLHQHQREVRTYQRGNREVRYVEATLEDVERANELAHDVLGRTLDELPPQTQKLLDRIHEMVSDACRRHGIEHRRDVHFTRREVREHTGWGNTQLKMHLKRLEELEYLLPLRGQRGQAYVYELLYDGEARSRERFMMGLLDVDELRKRTTGPAISRSPEKKSGSGTKKSWSSRPQVAPKSGSSRGGDAPAESDTSAGNRPKSAQNAQRGPIENDIETPQASRDPQRTLILVEPSPATSEEAPQETPTADEPRKKARRRA